MLLFKSMLEEGIFLEDWKKSNVVLVHKKESKILIKNYRPLFLLPIVSKFFERLLFNSLQTVCRMSVRVYTWWLMRCVIVINMKSIKVWIVTHQLVWGELFLMFRKPLIKFGMKLYVLIMSRTSFRVNSHSMIAWMSRNSLLETGT